MNNKLLELLYCPVTQSKLEYDNVHQVLISQAAQLVFPLHDGIPVMLESEAIPLEVWKEKNSPPKLTPLMEEQESTQKS